jgi:hypothetical protein
VLALGDKGVVEDLAMADWKIEVNGKAGKVLAQQVPAQMGKLGQRWAFILMPVRGPEFRAMALETIATFMTSLPASDSVLVVFRTAKGLECLTPGFTTRPSLWAKALDTLAKDLGGTLKGSPDQKVVLPASPSGEKEEGMEPVTAFLTRLAKTTMEKRSEDASTPGLGIMDTYPTSALGTFGAATVRELANLEQLAQDIAQVAGEKHLVLFSRNEIDDMANPVWGRMVGANNARGNSTSNGIMQAEAMIRDVTLAQEALKKRLTGLGLDLHSVATPGASYSGAFGMMAQATGGNNYAFNADLAKRLPQLLPLWAMRYQLAVALPAGSPRPSTISIDSPRKGVKLFAPRLQ